jgi:hypothetical protein
MKITANNNSNVDFAPLLRFLVHAKGARADFKGSGTCSRVIKPDVFMSVIMLPTIHYS